MDEFLLENDDNPELLAMAQAPAKLSFISALKYFQQGCPQNYLEELSDHLDPVFFAKNRTIVEQGQEFTNIYFVVSGTATFWSDQMDGDGEYFEGEGCVVGEIEYAEKQGRYCFTTEAVSNVCAYRLGLEALQKFFQIYSLQWFEMKLSAEKRRDRMVEVNDGGSPKQFTGANQSYHGQLLSPEHQVERKALVKGDEDHFNWERTAASPPGKRGSVTQPLPTTPAQEMQRAPQRRHRRRPRATSVPGPSQQEEFTIIETSEDWTQKNQGSSKGGGILPRHVNRRPEGPSPGVSPRSLSPNGSHRSLSPPRSYGAQHSGELAGSGSSLGSGGGGGRGHTTSFNNRREREGSILRTRRMARHESMELGKQDDSGVSLSLDSLGPSARGGGGGSSSRSPLLHGSGGGGASSSRSPLLHGGGGGGGGGGGAHPGVRLERLARPGGGKGLLPFPLPLPGGGGTGEPPWEGGGAAAGPLPTDRFRPRRVSSEGSMTSKRRSGEATPLTSGGPSPDATTGALGALALGGGGGGGDEPGGAPAAGGKPPRRPKRPSGRAGASGAIMGRSRTFSVKAGIEPSPLP